MPKLSTDRVGEVHINKINFGNGSNAWKKCLSDRLAGRRLHAFTQQINFVLKTVLSVWGKAFSDRLAGRRPHTLPAKSLTPSPHPPLLLAQKRIRNPRAMKMNYELGTSFRMMPVMVWGMIVPGKRCGADGWLFAGSITVDFTEFWTTYWIPE